MANNRMTPVQAAKVLGIRPQIIYGFIKHNRVGTFSNPAGKTAFVDLDEVKKVVGGVRPHREKDPTTGKPIRRTAGVDRGSILSYHGHMPGERKQRPHRVAVVTEVVKNDAGEPSLVYAKREGVASVIFEAEDLATRISRRQCFIESPEGLLGVLMFHYVHNDQVELAMALQVFCEQNNISPAEVKEEVLAS